ncbi:thioredoxin domain-containing protein [Deinococcus sp. HMF7604]|uniref:thioredoxin domain-containing protein n=1 Tax=Deinococcus betulae TaxID=2873312 RepID=UPI001CCBBBB1|nr:thioredoxin domain-containing protein [Deinococcus betulae]MBZ9753270.1 thioredoxin domain-containing protein [Deinococcus betulae]
MNRLSQESSPYLRQHADNPVDWWPWGEAAFAEAQRRDVPVLLSVGYATCHWCHVMAHESFEDEATAEYMNGHFVNVKVDREERPDVDAVYMAATQAMTGQGGWPMTVFLTPAGEPFYAGTYFPPRDGHGMPSFGRVMASVAHAWNNDRTKLLGNAQALTDHIREATRPQAGETEVTPDDIERAVSNLRRVFDDTNGGFGSAPKFPAPTTLDFLLTRPDGRLMALHTLRRMLAGGIHDQLGGGFHRYSVDGQWRVPHFEKMLYDNAQLTRTLLRAYQVSGDPAFADAARGTLAYLAREMHAPDGGFYSAQDADTEGVEGLTFTWTPAEIETALGSAEDAALVCRHLGIEDPGNFHDPHRPDAGRRSVPFVAVSVAELAAQSQESEEAVQTHLNNLKARLHLLRQGRPQPGTDDKVLTSWNGLALAAWADAARILGEKAYLETAQRTAQFLHDQMRSEAGGLYHVWAGGQARVQGLMEDHALVGLGLVALFQADGDERWLTWARDLWQVCVRDFWQEDAGVFLASGGQAEALLTRPAPGFDSAVLSDNAAGALLGLWMYRYFGDDADAVKAGRVLAAFRADMLAAAGGFGGLWQAAAFWHAPHTELAILGTSEERENLERTAARFSLPFTALAFSEAGGTLPLVQERPGGGTAYLCVNHACDLPTHDAATLERQLEALGEKR